MNNKFISNSFQVPNAIIERIDELSDIEFKCCLLYFRHAGEPAQVVLEKSGLQNHYHKTIDALREKEVL